MTRVLRLMCIQSQISNGLKPKSKCEREQFGERLSLLCFSLSFFQYWTATSVCACRATVTLTCWPCSTWRRAAYWPVSRLRLGRAPTTNSWEKCLAWRRTTRIPPTPQTFHTSTTDTLPYQSGSTNERRKNNWQKIGRRPFQFLLFLLHGYKFNLHFMQDLLYP